MVFKMENDKIALSPCTGLSPYGLVSRVSCTDVGEESDQVISICITATAADREGFRQLIKKYPIIAVNGCENRCVDKILAQKKVKVSESINIMEKLNQKGLKPKDVARLDQMGEKCVEVVKGELRNLIKIKLKK